MKRIDEAYYKATKEGFTLVELSLSLLFIAILSIAVVLVMTGAISSYHRSITLNRVENVGSGLVRDIRTSFQAAPAKSLEGMCEENYSTKEDDTSRRNCISNRGVNFATVTRLEKVRTGTVTKNDVPVFGALCTGTYSYIWNSGYFFDEGNYEVLYKDGSTGMKPVRLKYRLSGTAETKYYPSNVDNPAFKLLKVKDESRKVCEASFRVDAGEIKKNRYYIQGQNSNGVSIAPEESGSGIPTIDMAALATTDEEPMEYLMSSEDSSGNLAIYNMSTSVSEQIGITKNVYYYSSFVLGTVQGGIDIKSAGNFCAAPEGFNDAVENSDYCAINKFNFAALATGG